MEPQRVDVAVEFAYMLYLSAATAGLEARENAGRAEREEIMKLLSSFENAGLLNVRGQALLAWAREEGSDQPDTP